jgi:hypothetical protein
MAVRDLLLTTFPAHKSKNVGDNLISSSTMKMIRSRRPQYDPTVLFREAGLDAVGVDGIRSILAPGFSVSNDTYPKLFRLYTDLKSIPPFFPVGCSFQHPLPAVESFTGYEFNAATLDALGFLAERCGGLPCRDVLIHELMERHGIGSHYCGDLALFDEEMIGRGFYPPKDIRSLVFTIHHHPTRFDTQAKRLIDLLSARFPEARRYVAYHSKPNGYARAIAQYAMGAGFEELHLYGESFTLAKYHEVDLHVGYRLHGHIFFLRNRKPSILLIEDARSFGFSRSGAFSTGCVDAFDCEAGVELLSAPECAMVFLDFEINRGFSSYLPVFDMIDGLHENAIAPYFDRFCSLIN